MIEHRAKIYLNLGCGDVAVDGWINIDGSPALLVQKIPFIGPLISKARGVVFDDQIIYGDIVNGLTECGQDTVAGIFLSHVLEHVALEDSELVLANCFRLLEPGGLLRVIVPDLNFFVMKYLEDVRNDPPLGSGRFVSAGDRFMAQTDLGVIGSRCSSLKRVMSAFSNRRHLWMFDRQSLATRLSNAGFEEISEFVPNNCEDSHFILPEREHMFFQNGERYALSIQCYKPC